MIPIGGLIRWSWLLGIALCAPVALPAGGSEKKIPHVRFNQSNSEPFLTEKVYFLRGSPMVFSPSLRTLDIGTPIKVLGYFETGDGKRWIRISLTSSHLETPLIAKRGWVNG